LILKPDEAAPSGLKFAKTGSELLAIGPDKVFNPVQAKN